MVTLMTIPLGLVVAYANMGGAGPRMRTHYIFLIRTFWTAIGWWIIGGALLVAGVILSVVLVGIPIFMLGCLIFGVGHFWFGLRCVTGVLYLLRDEAYPRPRSWRF
jgi:uncharacterized membrane protein